jgi:hypothetical protein
MSPIHEQQDRSERDEQDRDTQDQNAGDQGGPDRPDTGARPGEILRDGIDQGAISDEEAVLAYNANAEDGDPEPGAAGD